MIGGVKKGENDSYCGGKKSLKMETLTKFLILEFCTHPLGMQDNIHSILVLAKFHFDHYILSPLLAKYCHNTELFHKILKIMGLQYPPLH